MGWVADARMSWLAPSGVLGWCGNRHRPGRAGLRLHDACQPAETAPISDITALSLRARLAIALRLFASYCERRGLAHPEIDRYLNHLWEFVGLSSGEGAFRRWVENEPRLIHAGLGDPYPVGLDRLLSSAGVPADEFRQVVGCTTEVLYGSLYAAADEA